MKPAFTTLLVLISASGCGADAYRRAADRQVQGILRHREQQVLAYTPEVYVGGAAGVEAGREAYRKVPPTPVPPPAPPPIEPPEPEPYGPLGPDPAEFLPPLQSQPRPAARLPARPEGTEDGPGGGGRLGGPAGVEGAADETDGNADDAAEDEANESRAYRAVKSEAEQLLDGRKTYERLVLGPPVPDRRVTRLDLFGALRYAVRHGRDYQDQSENLYLAALDVTLERHLFSPRPFARAGLQYAGGQADVNFRSALSATASAGVRQQLPYGGEIVAQALVQFVDALSGNAENGESADLVLTGSLPLLRGAGLVNLEPLISGERALIYQVRAFEEFRRSFAVAVASQYFSLLAQQQAVNNRLQNFANLSALLERTQALFESGRISFLEVQRSRQALLQAENGVLDSRESYLNGLDSFKVLLGMGVDQELEVVRVPLDVTIPSLDPVDALNLAERYRLDLQTARDRIDDAARQVAIARNGLLPNLDLTAQAGTGNRPGTPARAIDGRSLEYSAGLNLDLPLDRVGERNAYRAALIGFSRSQRDYEEQHDQVFADVRRSVRAIRSAQSSLRIQEQSIELARRRLDLANELLRRGNFNSRDAVEAQNSLLNAQDAYERAQSQLQIRVLQFLRDTGTLRVDPDAGAIGKAMERQSADLPVPSPAQGSIYGQ